MCIYVYDFSDGECLFGSVVVEGGGANLQPKALGMQIRDHAPRVRRIGSRYDTPAATKKKDVRISTKSILGSL